MHWGFWVWVGYLGGWALTLVIAYWAGKAAIWLLMAKVRVYQFKKWDNQRGEYVVLPRKATREHIEDAEGVLVAGTEQEVDEADVDAHGRYNPKGNPSRAGTGK